MPRIVFVSAAGERREVEVAAGTSAMRAAVDNGVPGIVADCGGSPACATCHVYVADEYLPLLPAVSDGEDTLLGFTASERQPGSRLSCQIVVTDALDGLTLRIPETQL